MLKGEKCLNNVFVNFTLFVSMYIFSARLVHFESKHVSAHQLKILCNMRVWSHCACQTFSDDANRSQCDLDPDDLQEELFHKHVFVSYN